jgi:large subunit ribosomal protein L23
MAKQILIRPLITEKSEFLGEKRNQYMFVVNKDANKIEIKNAVKDMYNVNVKAVNTLVMPGKSKTRSTKAGMIHGTKKSYKKAIITLDDGEMIDFFGEM